MMVVYKKKTRCVKCGCREISDQYCGFCVRSPFVHDKEEIHRHCKNCGYAWSEEPIDKKKK